MQTTVYRLPALDAIRYVLKTPAETYALVLRGACHSSGSQRSRRRECALRWGATLRLAGWPVPVVARWTEDYLRVCEWLNPVNDSR